MSTSWKWFLVTLLSVGFAFPIGGAIGNVAQAPASVLERASFGEFIFFMILGAYSATFNGGYTYGRMWQPISLHPWIIGTAIVLFVVGALSEGPIDLKSLWK
jgi:hypothetical protein